MGPMLDGAARMISLLSLLIVTAVLVVLGYSVRRLTRPEVRAEFEPAVE